MNTFTPTPDQKVAFDAVMAGKNILLTGPAGTGKSALLDHIKSKKRMSLTASTGIAALNIGGTTLHSWAGLGIGDRPAGKIVRNLLDKKGKAYNNILTCDCLAIDEISMISANFVTLLDDVLRGVRRNDSPFGGIQIVGVGDFLQLPPVSNNQRENHLRFAFNSPSWAEAEIQNMTLTTIVRQADAAFATVLSEIRQGIVTAEAVNMLRSRVDVIDPDPSIRPVILSSVNTKVDAYNARKLDQLPGEAKLFEAVDTGYDEQIEKLDKICNAPRLLALKPGAQVMLLKNLDVEGGLVNGTLGTVEKFDQSGAPVIKFKSGDSHTTVVVESALWEVKNEDMVLASRSQFPLRLAWAITIHKAQGMTLDKVRADLANVFEHGQGYVAISRARTLEGLFLNGFNPSRFTADPEALRFYREGTSEAVAPSQGQLVLA